MATEDDSIEEIAAARRERLRALKAAQDLLTAPDGDSVPGEEDTANDDNEANTQNNQSMKFRNYVPHDKKLHDGKLDPPVLPKFEDPVASEPPPTEKEDPFLNIAPKKPNWDLRRVVQKKLDKLEKRTQKAIYKLMEEQVKQKQEAEDGQNSSEEL